MSETIKRRYYVGTFYSDCSTNDAYLNSIHYIPYFKENGEYYTFANVEGTEFMKVPIKYRKSTSFPHTTGLLVSEDDRIITDNQAKEMLLGREDIITSIKNTSEARVPKPDEENFLQNRRKRHDESLPDCLKTTKEANYVWKLVPFVTAEKNEQGELKQIMVPALFLENNPNPLIFIDKWRLIEMPTKEVIFHRHRESRYFEKDTLTTLGYVEADNSIDISVEEALKWFKRESISSLREHVETIEFVSAKKMSVDSYNTLRIAVDGLNYLLEKGATNDVILKYIRSIGGLDKPARVFLHQYVLETFGERLKLENKDLSKSQIKRMTVIPCIPLYDTKGLEKVITIGDWTFLKKYSEGLKQTIIESSLPSTREHGYVKYGEKLYDLCVDSLGFEIIPGGIQNLNDIHGDIGWAATRALMGLVIGKCKRNAGIEKLSSVLLDKNLFDIARGLIKQEEDKKAGKTPQDVTINCVIIDDNIEGKSPIHFGKITIPPGINILGLRIDPRLNSTGKPLFDVSKVTYQELTPEELLSTDFIPDNKWLSDTGQIDKNKLNVLKRTGDRAS